MPKGELTIAQVDQAEAALQEAKAGGDVQKIKAAARAAVELRAAYRDQEVDAGRRAAGVGVGPGDANPSPPSIETTP